MGWVGQMTVDETGQGLGSGGREVRSRNVRGE